MHDCPRGIKWDENVITDDTKLAVQIKGIIINDMTISAQLVWVNQRIW
jgi:hypothetical protein